MTSWNCLLNINLHITGMPFSSSGPEQERPCCLLHLWFLPTCGYIHSESYQAQTSPSFFNDSLLEAMIYYNPYSQYITFGLHMLQGRRNNTFHSPKVLQKYQHERPSTSILLSLSLRELACTLEKHYVYHCTLLRANCYCYLSKGFSGVLMPLNGRACGFIQPVVLSSHQDVMAR